MKKVYGQILYELLPGVTEADFEAFVGRSGFSTLSRPGVTFHMLKGDRGDRKGRYTVLVEFESIETRDRLYPVEGGGTADAVLESQLQPFFEGMDKLVSRDWKWTDYVEIG